MKKLARVFIGILTLFACGKKNENRLPNDREIARVYQKGLWLSDMDGLFPAGMSKSDSAATIAAYVQNWSRTEIMEYEAERNIPQDLNIDALVRDYRASLVRHKYEEQIFIEKLDTTVTDLTVRKFYDDNRDLFLLQNSMLRCFVLKIKLPSAGLSDFQKNWQKGGSENLKEIAEWASRYAESSLLNAEKWYNLDEIAAILPKNTLSSSSLSKRDISTKDDGYQFYIRILETAPSGDAAPFEQAKTRIQAMILHRRKTDLINQWQDDLYNQEIRRENVRVF
jgi:hypothetical protein